MRTWVFVNVAERCGYCGAEIPEGAAAIEIALRGVKRRRYRGECCAGIAPPELPARPVLAAVPALDLSRLDALIPTRTRGALKSMAREHLAPQSESDVSPSLPRRELSDLRVDRQPQTLKEWLPHPDD